MRPSGERFVETVIRSVEFMVQPDAHSAAADINDAVSLVLQLKQVPCLPQ